MNARFTDTVHQKLSAAHQQIDALGTAGLQGWIKTNIVPVVILGLAVLMMVHSGKGDMAKIMKVGAGLLAALCVLGIAASSMGLGIGTDLAKLFN